MKARVPDSDAMVAALRAENDALRSSLDGATRAIAQVSAHATTEITRAVAAACATLTATAEQAAKAVRPTRWEYKFVSHVEMTASDMSRTFSRFGNDGWEMVGYTSGSAMFVRPAKE